MTKAREIKRDKVADLVGLYNESDYVFMVTFDRVNAANMLTFRREMRAAGAQVVVEKNTLQKVALKQLEIDVAAPAFKGQIMSIFTKDPVEVAKLLQKHASAGFAPIGCTDKSNLFTAAHVKRFSEVPSLPVLRSMLLSSLVAVHRKSLGVLSGVHGAVARLLLAYSQKK